jgi:GAF domain-containing protein
LGVLDLDSATKAAFTQQDADRLAGILAETFRDAVAQTGGSPPAGG